MNILLTSAGRRVALLKTFQEAARRWDGLVFAGDRDPLAPAFFASDRAFRLPRLTEAGYVDHLLGLVERHGIGLIVPTIDPELPILAEATAAFEACNCRVLGSSAAFVHTTADKWRTLQAFGAHGIRTPASWLPEMLSDAALPEHLFVKPRRGSASKDTYHVGPTQLSGVLPLVASPIIQEAIRTPEVTVDALLDDGGTLIHYVPRLRIRTLAGESVQGVTLPDDDLADWLQQVLGITASLGARGPITLQLFQTEEGPLLSEINPRFSGGFPLTDAAGGHYPAWILETLHGHDLAPRIGQYKKGLYMTRYAAEIFTEHPHAP